MIISITSFVAPEFYHECFCVRHYFGCQTERSRSVFSFELHHSPVPGFMPAIGYSGGGGGGGQAIFENKLKPPILQAIGTNPPLITARIPDNQNERKSRPPISL